jgi:hypothetical protein
MLTSDVMMQFETQCDRLDRSQELQCLLFFHLGKFVSEKQRKGRKYISVLILEILSQFPEPFHFFGELSLIQKYISENLIARFSYIFVYEVHAVREPDCFYD